MKTLWVIEDGDYSSNSVVGLYSTEANARAVAAILDKERGDYDKVRVSEWLIDAGVDNIRSGKSLFYVLMRRDGTVEQSHANGTMIQYYLADTFDIWQRSTAPAYKGKGIEDALQAYVWAKTEKAAIKITNEKRGQMIAMGKWA